MSSKSLMQYLQKRAAVTAVTSENLATLQRKAPIHADCTAVTAVTCNLNNAREKVQPGQFGEAVNDPVAPKLDSPASTQPPISDGADTHAAYAGLNKPVKPRKLTFMEWQQSWIEFDQAYQRHHLNCPVCIAAGLGYGLRCGAGAALYRAYEDAAGDRGGLS